MGDVSANGNPLPAAVHLGYDSRDKLPSDAKDRLMKFFVDTADIDAIAELNALGMVDGVTTNPSLILKSGRDILEVT